MMVAENHPAVKGLLRTNEPMAKHTSWRVGGAAELYFKPADLDDLSQFLRELDADVPVFWFGLGSNLLVRDGGLRGAVIAGAGVFKELQKPGADDDGESAERRVRVGSSVPCTRLARQCIRWGYGPSEFFAGIPGTVGGALRMNAGANGVETRERLVEARAVGRDGRRVTLTNADMGFTYRHTAAPDNLIFTDALFEGPPAERTAIAADMEAVQRHRESVQPIREKTGGSTFTNPSGTSAWKLIDTAGCRSLRIGGAMVSEMHCNFLINTGDATAHDLETLGETVRARVLVTSGVRLEWEIRRVGRFGGDEIAPFLGKA